MTMRPTVLEVSKGAFEQNYKAIAAEAAKGTGGGAKALCVVKANGYGMGGIQMARWLRDWGGDFFGVATPDEALELRQAGFTEPILVLGVSPADAAEFYVKEDIRPAMTDLAFAKRLSEAAVKLGKTAKVHMKVDSGMGRIGFLSEEYPAVAERTDEEVHFALFDTLGLLTQRVLVFATITPISGSLNASKIRATSRMTPIATVIAVRPAVSNRLPSTS